MVIVSASRLWFVIPTLWIMHGSLNHLLVNRVMRLILRRIMNLLMGIMTLFNFLFIYLCASQSTMSWMVSTSKCQSNAKTFQCVSIAQRRCSQVSSLCTGTSESCACCVLKEKIHRGFASPLWSSFPLLTAWQLCLVGQHHRSGR